jgi:hypothetical protein
MRLESKDPKTNNTDNNGKDVQRSWCDTYVDLGKAHAEIWRTGNRAMPPKADSNLRSFVRRNEAVI